MTSKSLSTGRPYWQWSLVVAWKIAMPYRGTPKWAVRFINRTPLPWRRILTVIDWAIFKPLYSRDRLSESDAYPESTIGKYVEIDHHANG